MKNSSKVKLRNELIDSMEYSPTILEDIDLTYPIKERYVQSHS